MFFLFFLLLGIVFKEIIYVHNTGGATVLGLSAAWNFSFFVKNHLRIKPKSACILDKNGLHFIYKNIFINNYYMKILPKGVEFMLQNIAKGLIVSCQALEDEPLHSSYIMGKMALAAKQAGAVGIRANSVSDILEIKKTVDLPIIGIIKKEYADTSIYITGTVHEVKELVNINCEMIAMDATFRLRHNNQTLEDFFKEVKKIAPNQLFMGDISSVEEAINAEKIGFDCVSTTLMGYTAASKGYSALTNNYEKLKEVVSKVNIPVIAEGHISNPAEALECLRVGAHALVVGGAITRPQQIAETFIAKMKEY